MALTSTIFSVSVDLSDIDRGVYESFALRLAMHPSESPEYLATRLLAYCLEYTGGIEMSDVSDGDEPAILIRDLTGAITGWIEVGMPDAERLHRASKLASHVAVYTHRDVRNLLGSLEGRRIHRSDEIAIHAFAPKFIREIGERFERRMKVSLSVTERHLYLDIDGETIETVVEEHRLPR
ncbi:MAG TPA: YaeQ family protein [Thermoanaerobaculia bacterium]